MNRKNELQNKDFNLQLDFRVKEDKESTEDILVIEGIANYFGTAKGDDYSQVYIDRAGEVVVPGGMDLKWFKKNPVILHNHDRDKVIGKAIAVSKKEDGIHIKAEVHKGACEDELFYAVQNGLLSTFSIGFACKAGEYKEINNRNVYFITKSELRECSIVTLPCNSESMFELKSLDDNQGFYAEDETKQDTDTEVPTHTSDVYKTQQGEETMKIALKELLSAAEVESFKSLGLEAKLDEEQEVSTKQYFDQLLAKAVAPLEARIAELEKVKASTEEQEKDVAEGEAAADEAGADESAQSDEGSEDEGKDDAKAVPEETVQALSVLSEMVTKELTAE